MAVNINLSNFLNNLSGNKGVENVYANNSKEVASTAKTAIEQLKNMLIGDIFTGEVTSFNGNNVSIRLGNGQQFNANILLENAQFEFAKGDMVTFQIDNKTDSSVSLKPLDINAQEMVYANKALEASNMAMTKENLDLVKGLIDLNMPIDRNTLNEVSRLIQKYPDAPVDTLLRMYKLELPVTPENITQFEAYKLYEHDITGTINNMAEDLTKLLGQLNNNGNQELSANVAKALIDVFVNNLNGVANEPVTGQNDTILQAGGQVNGEISGNISNEAVFDKLLSSLKEVLNSTPQDDKANVVIDFVNKNLNSDSEKLHFLKNMLDDSSFSKELTGKITAGKDFQNLFAAVLKDNLFIKPEDVADKKNVKEFYEKMLKVVSEGEDVLKKAGLEQTDLAKGMNSVKSNLDFMNDLNHQMAYIQIPVKLQQGEARGDLYVYTNKKALAGKTDDLTALLHLDMANLGPMDVYIRMTNGSNVTTNFCLESEEMLDFIYEHIDILTKRLNDAGYNFNPTMTVKDNSKTDEKNGPVDFVKDFLDVTSPVIPVSRYLFDTKA